MITFKEKPKSGKKILKKIISRKGINRKKYSRRGLFSAFTPKPAYTPQHTYNFEGPSEKGIDPYTGPWTIQQAGHLLRRTMFGPTYAQIKQAVTDGMNATVAQLLAPQPAPGPPLNHNYPDDPNVPIGSSWLDMPFIDGIDDEQYMYRHESLRGWLLDIIINEGVSLREKMTLFWHNHFVTGDIDEPNALYRYVTLLRNHALGNFRQLTKDITTDAAMLYYLNGNENIVDEPNENFARELLELFTIGKGPQVGPGDYTNYTEQDVVALAKVFTGWQIINEYSYDINETLDVQFFAVLHDTGAKQLSPRFNNTVINNNGPNEYKDAIDVIFQQAEVARFIVRKLYRWFVYYDINDTVEQKVIEPLAQIMIANDYEVAPVLETLFKSEHFFDILSMGCFIKTPIDFAKSVLKQFPVPIPDSSLEERYKWFEVPFYWEAEMGMEYLSPPSVAGWKAFYQVPGYYRIWINAVTLKQRSEMSTGFIWGFNYDGQDFGVNVIEFLQSIDQPADPNSVVAEFAMILLPMPLTDGQKTYLKGVLIPGLPDFEWTMEYNNYLDNPNDATIKEAVEDRLKNLLTAIVSLAEYQLI